MTEQSPIIGEFNSFWIHPCTFNDKPTDPIVCFFNEGFNFAGGTALWTGHYIIAIQEGSEHTKAGFYPVQHVAGRWYELAFDTLHKRHYAYRDASM